jgi:hypothetical protein
MEGASVPPIARRPQYRRTAYSDLVGPLAQGKIREPRAASFFSNFETITEVSKISVES